MTDAERDSLIRAMVMAVRDLQFRHEKLVNELHNIGQRLSLQEVAVVIEEMSEGEIPEKKH